MASGSVTTPILAELWAGSGQLGVGVGFTIGSDQINVSIEAGPRFYTPGSYSGLDQRTDFAGEIELMIPVGDANLFAHWQPTYSGTDAPGWGEGWQHHIGTGMSFTF